MPVVLPLALLATCVFFPSHKASSFGTINAFLISCGHGQVMEIMQIRAFSKRSYEKTKANLQFIFTGFVAQFSKFLSSYILSLSRLSFYFLHGYTRTKKVMFRALMRPRITSFQKDIASRVYIFNSYKRVLLKELFFLFVILKAFLARQKRAR